MKKTLLTLALSSLAAMPMMGYDFESGGLYYNRLSDSTVEVTFGGTSDGSEAWIDDITFDCVAEDGTIHIHPRRIAGLLPRITPQDAATWSDVTFELVEAGTSKDNMLASLYTVNYWMPNRVRFPELQGYRVGECTLKVSVTNPKDASAQPFVKEFTVKIENDEAETPENGYLDGTILLNEEWFSHTNGSLNYLTPDNKIIYQAYERENPGMAFGATSQFATIWADKLLVVSKQAQDGGDPLPGGGRLVIADAKSLKRLGSLDTFTFEKEDGTKVDGGDGRAVAGATQDKIYVTTSGKVMIVNIADPGNPIVTGCVEGNTEGDSNAQFGDIINGGRYVYALMQANGIMVIDPLTDKYVRTIGDANTQGVTQTADGTIWYTTVVDGHSRFVGVNPETLEETDAYDMPASIGKVLCGWSAWRSTAFYGDYENNEIWFVTGAAAIMGGASGDYYRYVIGENPEEIEHFFTLTDVTGITDFGEEVGLMTYGTPRFDPRNNHLVVMCGRKGAASGGYRDHWLLLVDGDNGEIKETIKLEPYYWFQSLPVFPDKYDAEFELEDQFNVALSDGETSFELAGLVSDRDNIDANIRMELAGGEVMPLGEDDNKDDISDSSAEPAEGSSAAEISLAGKTLVVNPRKAGTERVTLRAISNGRPVEKEIAIVVSSGSSNVDGILTATGYVTCDGDRIVFNGLNGVAFDIYDLNGRHVMTLDVDAERFVAQPGLAQGAYILRGSNGMTSKVIIK